MRQTEMKQVYTPEAQLFDIYHFQPDAIILIKNGGPVTHSSVEVLLKLI